MNTGGVDGAVSKGGGGEAGEGGKAKCCGEKGITRSDANKFELFWRSFGSGSLNEAGCWLRRMKREMARKEGVTSSTQLLRA